MRATPVLGTGRGQQPLLIRCEKGGLRRPGNSRATHSGLDLGYEIYGSDGSLFIDPTGDKALAFSRSPH